MAVDFESAFAFHDAPVSKFIVQTISQREMLTDLSRVIQKIVAELGKDLRNLDFQFHAF